MTRTTATLRNRLLALLVLAALAVHPSMERTAEAASTDASIRLSAKMATVSGWFRDSPVVEAVFRTVLDNSDASKISRMTGTLAGSATANIDTVAGLTLIDGSTSATIALIKMIAIRVSNPAANQILKLGVGAANGLTTLVDTNSAAIVVGGGINDGFGGWMFLSNPAGWAAVAGTDIIVLTNSGSASLNYELVLIGT